MINRTRTLTLVGVSAAMLFGSVAATCGDTTTRIDNSGSATQGIVVSGNGKATGKPDIAQITLGVSKLADTVQQARDDAAASLDAMIKSVQANGVGKDDIQTQQFNISPEYDYTNGRQRLTGFRVTNVVAVKLRDINKTSQVVDDAVNVGGDNAQVQGISFTIDKPEDLQRQARENAVADAKKKAQTLANATGVTVGDPIAISETNVQGGPLLYNGVARDAAAPAAAPSTPIETGTLDVTVDVNVTWSIK
ncbi:MAG: SIMPL domain-containing protein [Chloroflexota bacterium]|nr:SIMPL domain-containing protein [Chloroflexota bacterium]